MENRASPEDVATILARVLAESRLRRIPRHPGHREIVLGILCRGLKRRYPYSEPELKAHLEVELAKMNASVDHVTCRRYLVDLGFVKRDRAGTRHFLNYPKLEATLSEAAMESAGDLVSKALLTARGRSRKSQDD